MRYVALRCVEFVVALWCVVLRVDVVLCCAVLPWARLAFSCLVFSCLVFSCLVRSPSVMSFALWL